MMLQHFVSYILLKGNLKLFHSLNKLLILSNGIQDTMYLHFEQIKDKNFVILLSIYFSMKVISRDKQVQITHHNKMAILKETIKYFLHQHKKLLIKNPDYLHRTKYIHIKYFSIKEHYENRFMDFQYIYIND